jgi:hypothetical protein
MDDADDASRAPKKQRVVAPVPAAPLPWLRYDDTLLPLDDLEEEYLFKEGAHDLYYHPRPETRDDAVDPDHRARRLANVKWYRESARLDKERYAEFNARLAALARTPGRIPKAPPLADALEFYLLNHDLVAFEEAIGGADAGLVKLAFANHGRKLYYAAGLGGAYDDSEVLSMMDLNVGTSLVPAPVPMNGIVPDRDRVHELLPMWQWFVVGVYERANVRDALFQLRRRLEEHNAINRVLGVMRNCYTICARFLIRALLDRDDKDGLSLVLQTCLERNGVSALDIIGQCVMPQVLQPIFRLTPSTHYLFTQYYASARRCFNLGPKCAAFLLTGDGHDGVGKLLVAAITEQTRALFDTYVGEQAALDAIQMIVMVRDLSHWRPLTPFLADCVKGWMLLESVQQAMEGIIPGVRDVLYTWAVSSGRYDLFGTIAPAGNNTDLRFAAHNQAWLDFGPGPALVVTAPQMTASLTNAQSTWFREVKPGTSPLTLAPVYSFCFHARLVVEGSLSEWKELLKVSVLNGSPDIKQWLLLSILRTVPRDTDHDDAARLVLAGIMVCEAVTHPRFLPFFMQQVAHTLHARRSPVLWEEYFYGPTGRQLVEAFFELEADERARMARAPQSRDDVHQVGTRRGLTFTDAILALLEKYALAAERFAAMWKTLDPFLVKAYQPRYVALDFDRDDSLALDTLHMFNLMTGTQWRSELLRLIADGDHMRLADVVAARGNVTLTFKLLNTPTVRAMRHMVEKIIDYM